MTDTSLEQPNSAAKAVAGVLTFQLWKHWIPTLADRLSFRRLYRHSIA